jgi:hypothetical protein
MVRISFSAFGLAGYVAAGVIEQGEYQAMLDEWINIVGPEAQGQLGAVWAVIGDGYRMDMPNFTPAQIAYAIMRVLNVAGVNIAARIAAGGLPPYPRPGAPPGVGNLNAMLALMSTSMITQMRNLGGALAGLFTNAAQQLVQAHILANGAGNHLHPWAFPNAYDAQNGPVLADDCPGDDPSRRRRMAHSWEEGTAGSGPNALDVAGHWSGCSTEGCTPMLPLSAVCPPSSQCEIQHSDVDTTCGDERSSGHDDCMTCMDQHYPNTSCDINAWCSAPSPGKKPLIRCNTLNRADCQLASYCHWDTASSPHNCKTGAPPHPAPTPAPACNTLSASQCVAANTRCHWDDSAHDDHGACVSGAAPTPTPSPTPGQQPCNTLDMAGCIGATPRCHWQERPAGTGGGWCIPGDGPVDCHSLNQAECTTERHHCNWVEGSDAHCEVGPTPRSKYCKQLVDNCNYVNKFHNAYGVCESSYSWKCAGDNAGCNCTWKDNKCQNSSARCQWDSDDKCCSKI